MVLADRTPLLIFGVLAGLNPLLADRVTQWIDDVEEIRRKSLEYLGGPVYERIENFPNISDSILDMYAKFGDLLLDGQICTCERKMNVIMPCLIRVNSGSDARLREKAVEFLSELGGMKGTAPFVLSLPNPRNDSEVGSIIEQEEAIFERTWDYYGYLTGEVSGALNASASLQTDLEPRCGAAPGWVANTYRWGTGLVPDHDKAINLVLHDVNGNCKSSDYRRRPYQTYADKHGFAGGDSSNCLQNFVIRYNNYDENAYEAFVEEIHKYLFQDLTIYGMCISFTEVSKEERARRKEWLKEKLTTLSSHLLKAREVLKETPPTTSQATTKAPPVWWSPRLLREDGPTSAEVHSIVTSVLKSDGSDIDQLPGKERPSRYRGIIDSVVTAIKKEYPRFAESGSIEGVMYVPNGGAKDDLFCALPWPDNTTFVAHKENYMGASYFIKWTENPTPSEVLRSRIAFMRERSSEDITWNTIFEQHEDTCGHVRLSTSSSRLTINGTYLGQTYSKESSGFTAVLAVRCTNEFVWYELGWRYYTAAVTTANDYVVSRADGEYSNSCGQLIFLP